MSNAWTVPPETSGHGRQHRGRLVLTAAALLAAAIFLIDTISPLDMAIAVLYVVVVVFAGLYLERRGLLLVGLTCIALTVLSFLIMHLGEFTLSNVMRAIVSIAAISVTTVLSLKNLDATLALREKASLLDLTHDAIFVRGPNDVITYWNDGAEQLYGWTRAEAMGQKTCALLGTIFPAPPEEIEAELQRAGRWEGTLEHTRRDGSKVIVMSRWSLQRDERGRPRATMETNSDVTERMQTEDALHEAQTELAHVTRVTTMGELTASIAHEINQPLAAVVTHGEACLRWLGRPEPDIEEAKASLGQIISNGRRASEVVARLRALARRGTTAHLPVDVDEAIGEALLLVERELLNHRVQLHLSGGQGLPPIQGDRVQLQQVVINLALNAIQAMDGVPEARRRLEIETALVAAGNGPRRVEITIADHGPGVPAEALPLLFNAFYSTKADGMGMGLSISRSIIEAHGGSIDAALNEAGGMRFCIALPTAEESVT